MKLERHWYQPSLTWLTCLLLPLSWLFSLCVSLRKFLYQKQIKKSFNFSVPVIVVGNITVGGTGKTPLVIWLSEFLRSHGLKPGIVSRGVGGKMQIAPRWVNADDHPGDVGDEALLLVKRTQVPLVIGIDRVAAVRELLAKSDCNVVISDDGLQHYRLARDVEIAVIDGARELGNQRMLPAGPLREAVKRLHAVDLVIRQTTELNIDSSFSLQGDFFVSVINENEKKSITDFKNKTVHAVAAIGNPQRFFSALRAAGLDVIEHVFPDHYLFKADDILFHDGLDVIMTEKDAVKCKMFANAQCWYWSVSVKVNPHVENKMRELLCVN